LRDLQLSDAAADVNGNDAAHMLRCILKYRN